jgi:hypothetical protein
VNTPPIITSSPVVIAAEGVAYQYQVTATDDAGAANLTYSLGGSAPSGMSIIPATGLITWTPTVGTTGGGGVFIPGQAPAQGVTVTVTDSGGLYDKQAFIIAVNGAPRFLNTAPTTGKALVQYVYQPITTDPNPGDLLTYSLVLTPSGPTGTGAVPMIINPTTGRVTWTPGTLQTGFKSFAVKVTDPSGASSTRTTTVNVAP